MSSEPLDRECRSFVWALVSDAPTDAVLEAYARAHRHPAFQGPASLIDRSLIRVGAVHPWLAKVADAYAALLVRDGLFRTKLVVLLAILESGAPHHGRFEPEPRSAAVAWLRLTGWGLGAALALLLGIVLFGPVHGVSALAGRERPAAGMLRAPDNPAADHEPWALDDPPGPQE